jgi:dihydroorotate dehydrogenase electron transfer subunit
MIQHAATVLWNHRISPDCHHLALGCDADYSSAEPGQFVMVQVRKDLAPLLRRPYSIAGLIGQPGAVEGIELLIKVVGEGTAQLSRLAKGEQVDILGPLGRGFEVNPDHRCSYLVAGGIGVAPIRFLAQTLIAQGMDPAGFRIFLGGQSQSDLLCRSDFESLNLRVTITTDDGSVGDQCLITDPLEIAIQDKKPDMVYACGPHGMLICIIGIGRRTQAACQISIETLMACGLGACLGCAVDRADQKGYLHACMDGPVFNAREIQI